MRLDVSGVVRLDFGGAKHIGFAIALGTRGNEDVAFDLRQRLAKHCRHGDDVRGSLESERVVREARELGAVTLSFKLRRALDPAEAESVPGGTVTFPQARQIDMLR